METKFTDLGLSATYLQAVESLNYEIPTPIQQQAIPLLLQRKNVVGQAQTGTGKTAAFALPLLQNLSTGTGQVQALILTPTRELANQIANATKDFARFSNIQVTPVYGGQSYQIQIRQLKRGADVVVGTPGRLMDLMDKGVLDLSHVNFVVLDEADEMLDMGFAEDVETILQSVPSERQIALFSATFPNSVKKIVNKHVSNPEHIRINPANITVAETDQSYCFLREDNKLAALSRLLEMEEIQSALIFTRTKIRAQEVSDELNIRGFQSESLHGDLNQDRRESVLRRLRAHSISILVATDVAARGLDIDDLSHVINFDIPQDGEDYVHRIGRTGRAGKKGIAITFITPKERQRLPQIEAYTKQKISESQIPSVEAIKAQRESKFIEKLQNQLGKGSLAQERAIITKLSESSYDLIDIAAAAIQLVRAQETAKPLDEFVAPVSSFKVIRIPDKKGFNPGARRTNSFETIQKTHSAKTYGKPINKSFGMKINAQLEDGMVRLKMNLGGRHGIRPGDIVGAIASEVGIPGKAIGEIMIQDDQSFVDIAEQHLRKVLHNSSGKFSVRGKPVYLSLAQ